MMGVEPGYRHARKAPGRPSCLPDHGNAPVGAPYPSGDHGLPPWPGVSGPITHLHLAPPVGGVVGLAPLPSNVVTATAVPDRAPAGPGRDRPCRVPRTLLWSRCAPSCPCNPEICGPSHLMIGGIGTCASGVQLRCFRGAAQVPISLIMAVGRVGNGPQPVAWHPAGAFSSGTGRCPVGDGRPGDHVTR